MSITRTLFIVSMVQCVYVRTADDMPSDSDDTMSVTSGLHYLRQFGYLSSPQDPQTSSLLTEEAMTEAVKEFQRFAGIPVTGKLDAETSYWMKLPRCGVKDPVGDDRRARRRRYALQGSKWAKKEISFRITEPTSKLSRSDVNWELKKAFQVWGDASPLKFTRVYDMRVPVDIDIRFTRGAHGDGNPFDGRGSTLAHAFFPQFGGDAHFDEDEPWTADVPKGVNLFQVAAHEFGHSLGLSHSDVRSALMAPFYRGYQTKFDLDPDDIAAIQELYGHPYQRGGVRTLPPTRIPIPTKGPAINIPAICRDSKVDAITRAENGLTYLFKGKHYYRLNDYGIDPGYPRLISNDFKGLAGPIDAALTWNNGYTYIFKGQYYWKFVSTRPVYSKARLIRDGFKGIPDDIDAAFEWGGNGKTYFVKGNKYYRYTRRSKDYGYPKPLSVWKGLPNKVDASFKWKNGRTYFFYGQEYYRFNDQTFQVDEGYPRQISNWWLGCPDKDQIKQFDNSGGMEGVDQKTLNSLHNEEEVSGTGQWIAVKNPTDITGVSGVSQLYIHWTLVAITVSFALIFRSAT